MIASPAEARVLVASDVVSDAQQIVRLLGDHFAHVFASTSQTLAAQDFETHKPDVLVLAFDGIAKAQSYYLGLYRFGRSLQQHPHRTVLLCNKEELPEAFALCKKQYFDDYVLYWPFAHDGWRLPMSIWNAAREMMTTNASAPHRAEFISYSQQLDKLEKTPSPGSRSGEAYIGDVQESLSRLERKLESGEHDLAQYPADSEAAGSAPKTDKALAQENERLKTQQLAKTRVAGYEGLESPSASPSQFKQQVEPALSGTRVLSESVRGDRRLLMLIDDDELTGDLLVGALNGQAYEITSVRDGVEALHELRRIRPDVIFMDIGLPGIDGVSLTRRLKASPHLAQVPVVMITGDARRETITRSIEAGAADFIVKPFTRESLTAKLQKLLSV